MLSKEFPRLKKISKNALVGSARLETTLKPSCHSWIDSARRPKQKYKYFTGSKMLSFAYYIKLLKNIIPLLHIFNGFMWNALTIAFLKCTATWRGPWWLWYSRAILKSLRYARTISYTFTGTHTHTWRWRAKKHVYQLNATDNAQKSMLKKWQLLSMTAQINATKRLKSTQKWKSIVLRMRHTHTNTDTRLYTYMHITHVL